MKMNIKEKTAFTAICTNSILTFLKFIFSALSGSLALLSEAWHSLLDILTSFSIWLSFWVKHNKRINRIKTKFFNYPLHIILACIGLFKLIIVIVILRIFIYFGIFKYFFTKIQTIFLVVGLIFLFLLLIIPEIFKKNKLFNKNKIVPELKKRIEKFFNNLETHAALIISLLLLGMGIGIINNVFKAAAPVIKNPIITGIVICLSSFFSYLLYKFESHIGKKENSIGLIADSNHSRMDAIGSLLVSLGIFGEFLNIRCDKIIAVIIAIFILVQSLEILINVIYSYIKQKPVPYFTKGRIVHTLLIRPGGIKEILEFIFKKLNLKINARTALKYIKKFAVISILIFLIIYYISTSFFIVKVEEQGIIERFGKPIQIKNFLGPGLHFKFPFPIDKVRIGNIKNIRRLTVGFLGEDVEKEAFLWTVRHYQAEAPFLTGNNEIVTIYLSIHYRISDLYDYFYRNRNIKSILKTITLQKLTLLISQEEIFSLIIEDRSLLENKLTESVKSRLDKILSGIEVTHIYFKDIHPPVEVAASFEDVISAQEDYETFINNSIGQKNQIVLISSGDAFSMISKAKEYAVMRKEHSSGEAKRFLQRQKYFYRYSGVIKKRLYLEAMEKAYEKPEKILLDSKLQLPPDLWLQIQKGGK